MDVNEELITNTNLEKIGFASVMYTPEDETAPTPAPPTSSQDLSSSYYFVYNLQQFIHSVNKAIQFAWGDLKSKYAISGLGGISYFCTVIGNTFTPLIDFNPETNRIFLQQMTKCTIAKRMPPENTFQ